MLLARVMTSLFGAPLLLGAGYVGGAALVLLVAFMVVTGVFELHALQRAGREAPPPPVDVGLLGALAFVGTAAVQASETGSGASHSFGPMGVAALVLVLYALVRCAFDGRGDPIGRAALGVVSALYVGGTLSTFLLLRGAGDGGWASFVLLVGTTWALDIGAYFGGRTFGRTPLAARLSPKKTVEGAVSGFVAAVAAAFALSVLFHQPVLAWTLIGAAAGVVGQVGDLVESAIKRHAGAKDSGRLLPGHGGVLDRFDSFTFAAPTVYLLLAVFGSG